MHLLRVLATAAVAVLAAPHAVADTFPSRPIRILLPQGAGGGADIVARMMAPEMQKRLGQPVLIENRPGGNESIAPDAVAKSLPDGYTLGVISATHSVNQTSAGIKLPFDPQKAFVPVAPMMSLPMVVIVNSSLGIGDVKTLVARSKAAPGTFNYGSAGPKTFAGIATEWFVRVSGADITGVTYGTKGILQGLVSNDIQMAFGGQAASAPIVQTGKAKVIAVTSGKRAASLPEIPAVAETYPGFDVTPWYGFIAPAGTPASVVEQLNRAIGETMRALTPRLLEMGNEPMVMTPIEFQAFLTRDVQAWTRIVDAVK